MGTHVGPRAGGCPAALIVLFVLLAFTGGALAAEGSGGTTPCEPPNVPVKEKITVTNNTGEDANDVHFYMYQNDQPHVQVLGARAQCAAFNNVQVNLDSNDNRDIPAGEGPPFHGASVDMSGGNVPAGATIEIDVELCMNEKNCLKIKAIEWTKDGAPLVQPPKGGVNGGWRVGQPFPGGTGGAGGDPGGGGRGAQEGSGGGDGNWVHLISIENDDLVLCMYVEEVKVLASSVDYADLNAIDWDAIDPVMDDSLRPPVTIPPQGSWNFPFETSGSYLGGHVYLRVVAYMLTCAKSGKSGDNAEAPIVVGDHPNPDASPDLDADGLWDAWEYGYGLSPADDGSTDPDNGALGDPDGDGIVNSKEQQLLTDPTDGTSPRTVESGYDLLQTTGAVLLRFGTALPAIPAGFFGPTSDPFTGVMHFTGKPLLTSPACPGPLGDADTIIWRMAPCAHPSVPSADSTPAQIVALSLKTVEPIRVTSEGGMVESFFDVFLSVSPGFPNMGNVSISRQHGVGGGADIFFNLVPLFRFTKVDDPGNTFDVLGSEFGVMGPMTGLGIPWEELLPPCVRPACASNFIPGCDDGALEPFVLDNPQLGPWELTAVCPETAVPEEGDVLEGRDLLVGGFSSRWAFGMGLPPLPAGFFAPGSDPFEGIIHFEGLPIESMPPCSGDLGESCLILKRAGPARVSALGEPARVPVEIEGLSLTSTTPIEGAPESFFDVFCSISPGLPSTGVMTITREYPEGGQCDLDLWICPRFVFVDTANPANTRAYDGAEEALVVHWQARNVPWIADSSGLNWPDTCASNFAIGVSGVHKSISGEIVGLRLSGIGAQMAFVPEDLSPDEDADGLSAFEEDWLNTDPGNPDTDDDQLPDGWEHQYHLDPLSADGDNGASGDPDGDRVSNLLEYQHGTDPLDPAQLPRLWVCAWPMAAALAAAGVLKISRRRRKNR